jgi:hypothetical protein
MFECRKDTVPIEITWTLNNGHGHTAISTGISIAPATPAARKPATAGKPFDVPTATGTSQN